MSLLADLVAASSALAGKSGRNEKVAIIAEALKGAGSQAPLAARYLAGDPPQGRLDVGWATVRDTEVPPAAEPSLTLADVDEALSALAGAGGAGSQRARRDTLASLMARATGGEQRFLRSLILGDMRQGANEGVVTKGVAVAAGVPEAAVQRALMLCADLGEVTERALGGGVAALEEVGLTVGRGVLPMLASTAQSVADVVTELGTVLVDWKLDGVRTQVHLWGDGQVRVFTRNLNDVTERSAATIEAVRGLPVRSAILDGEVLAVGADGRPVPFQETASAFANLKTGGGVSPFFFDVLHLDGEDLLDEPLHVRRAHLERVVPEHLRIPGRVVDDADEGEAVAQEALDHGHEGVVVKALDAPYAAGRRGKSWRKVKPVRTLDLVVLGVEWGSGRRQGWLSNLHLGARDPETGGFVMLGKTFKGMTDAMLRWQTERFQELETHRDERTVYVRPEQVVEIALDGVQASTRYPGGVALRFARVVRYRDDKEPKDADTIDTVRALRG